MCPSQVQVGVIEDIKHYVATSIKRLQDKKETILCDLHAQCVFNLGNTLTYRSMFWVRVTINSISTTTTTPPSNSTLMGP